MANLYSQLDSHCIHGGYLCKKGVWHRAWKKRFFVLYDDRTISYFEKEKHSKSRNKAKGSIHLTQIERVELVRFEDPSIVHPKSQEQFNEIVTNEPHHINPRNKYKLRQNASRHNNYLHRTKLSRNASSPNVLSVKHRSKAKTHGLSRHQSHFQGLTFDIARPLSPSFTTDDIDHNGQPPMVKLDLWSSNPLNAMIPPPKTYSPALEPVQSNVQSNGLHGSVHGNVHGNGHRISHIAERNVQSNESITTQNHNVQTPVLLHSQSNDLQSHHKGGSGVSTVSSKNLEVILHAQTDQFGLLSPRSVSSKRKRLHLYGSVRSPGSELCSPSHHERTSTSPVVPIQSIQRLESGEHGAEHMEVVDRNQDQIQDRNHLHHHSNLSSNMSSNLSSNLSSDTASPLMTIDPNARPKTAPKFATLNGWSFFSTNPSHSQNGQNQQASPPPV